VFNSSNTNYTQAVRETVNYCIANDILSDFLREQGGKIVSILTTEYDVEIAKRVYGEELLEDRNIELAREMLTDGEAIEKIIKWTKLSREIIESL